MRFRTRSFCIRIHSFPVIRLIFLNGHLFNKDTLTHVRVPKCIFVRFVRKKNFNPFPPIRILIVDAPFYSSWTMITAGCRRLSSFSACSFHLASTSCLLIFFFSFFLPVLSFRNHQRSLPLSSEPADDRLTFGLMALAGSRRWWMTLGERETFGAIRRFKRFFVTGARYVAAPAWPATMRQKQCWLIAFQNCERWKTIPGHRWWRARFWERRPLFHVFFRDSKGVGEGRGFEERSGIRGNRRAVQLNQVAAIAALDRPLEERSSIERWHTRVFVSMIRPLFSRNSFRFGEGISHCILSVEFVIYFSFFLLFFFFFTRCLGRRKCELLFLLLFIWTEESVRGIIPSWAQKTNLIIPVDPANSISGNLKW